MNKMSIFLLLLTFVGFASFSNVTDNVNLEWSDNNFQAVDIAVGNIDDDPQLEAVIVGTAGSAWEEMGIAVFELSSDAITFEDSFYLSPSAPLDAYYPTSVMLCDVDNDGTKDIVTGGYIDWGVIMDKGFIYTYEFDGTISPQYDYDSMSFTRIEAIGARQSATGCSIHAAGTKNTPGHQREYTAIFNAASGILNMTHEFTKDWFTDSSAYGIDFFQNGTVVTAGTAEGGWVGNQYVSLTINPGNLSHTFGFTGTNKEATSLVIANITSSDPEEIIIGVDSSSIITDTAYLYVFNNSLSQLAYVSFPTGYGLYNSYLNDVEVCDIDNDGAREVFAAVEYHTSRVYSMLKGHNTLQIFHLVGLLGTSEYNTTTIGAGYESSLQALRCANTDDDTRMELVSVINLANSTNSDYKIVLAVLEDEPIVPEITVISPSDGEALSGMFTPSINVTDDAAPGDLIVQYRIISSNMTSYYQTMNNTNYHFYATVNLSSYPGGGYTLQFKATDDEGNEDIEAVHFFVDNTLLTVTLVQPAEGSIIAPGTELYFSSSHPLISFTYSIDNGTTNDTLSAPYLVETGTWDDGPTYVDVWAESITGQLFHDVFEIAIDGTAPEITAYPSDLTIYPGENVAIFVQDYALGSLVFEYSNFSVDYTGASLPIVLDTSSWDAGIFGVRVIAIDVAGNPSTEYFGFNVLAAEVPSEPAGNQSMANLSAEVADLIGTVEQEIADAVAAGEETSLAKKALSEAKRLFSLGKYKMAQRAVLDARDKIGQSVPGETPPTEPPPTEPPQQPPVQPPQQPPQQPPAKPQQPPAEEIPEQDNTILLAGALLLALLVLAALAYFVLRKPKPPAEPPVEETEPEEFEAQKIAEPQEVKLEELLAQKAKKKRRKKTKKKK
ncbi:hypothetical protein KKB44_01180 [Candidatus Micrarchaeota archaeon]|nr:hypothetical protein [Candidatus Micrarchaeota archaeon]